MKKSEAFKLAQVVVVESPVLSTEAKVEIIKCLAEEEKMALIMEKDKEQGDGI